MEDDISTGQYIAAWALLPLGLLFYMIQIVHTWRIKRTLGLSLYAYCWNTLIQTIWLVFSSILVFWQGIIFQILSILLNLTIVFMILIIESKINSAKQQLLSYIDLKCFYDGQLSEITYVSPRVIRVVFLPNSSLGKELGNEPFYVFTKKNIQWSVCFVPH